MTQEDAGVAIVAIAGPTLRVLARIHATVELERALAEHGADPALAATTWNEPLLGARVAVVPRPGRPALAVAEPSTEGRLAGALARNGEGDVGAYVAGEASLAEVAARAAGAGVAVSRIADGPYGPELLLLTASSLGALTIIVEPAAKQPVPSPR